MVFTLGHQYNTGEKPSVMLSTVGFHIQRIGCQPEKNTLYGGHSRSWSAEQGKYHEREGLAAHPPPPPPRYPFGENKIKITRRIYMPKRYAGLSPSRVRTRIISNRRLGQWVSLRKTLHFFRMLSEVNNGCTPDNRGRSSYPKTSSWCGYVPDVLGW